MASVMGAAMFALLAFVSFDGRPPLKTATELRRALYELGGESEGLFEKEAPAQAQEGNDEASAAGSGEDIADSADEDEVRPVAFVSSGDEAADGNDGMKSPASDSSD